MTEEHSDPRDAAEIMRKKYLYRQLIFSGRLVLSHKRAAELLGPDCMYQLYSLRGSKETGPRRKSGRRHGASRKRK